MSSDDDGESTPDNVISIDPRPMGVRVDMFVEGVKQLTARAIARRQKRRETLRGGLRDLKAKLVSADRLLKVGDLEQVKRMLAEVATDAEAMQGEL